MLYITSLALIYNWKSVPFDCLHLMPFSLHPCPVTVNLISSITLLFLKYNWPKTVGSVQFSCSVVSDSLRPHELQHARPPCPSPTPGVYSNSCPSSRWRHPAISSFVIPFSSCPQSLPASEFFPMSQLFAWGGQCIEFQLQHQSFQWTPRTDIL